MSQNESAIFTSENKHGKIYKGDMFLLSLIIGLLQKKEKKEKEELLECCNRESCQNFDMSAFWTQPQQAYPNVQATDSIVRWCDRETCRLLQEPVFSQIFIFNLKIKET